jgi:hypothetical protein
VWGGIFDAENQRKTHEPEMIMFGLDIIKRPQLLNIEFSKTLGIRDEHIAEVLAVNKPTFDILDPAICLTALMYFMASLQRFISHRVRLTCFYLTHS